MHALEEEKSASYWPCRHRSYLKDPYHTDKRNVMSTARRIFSEIEYIFDNYRLYGGTQSAMCLIIILVKANFQCL